MAVTIFSNSTTAYAEEVSANFLYVGQGDFLPMANSGTMENTSGVYDLGSENYKFNSIYLAYPTITSNIITDRVLYEIQLTAPVATLDITNLSTASYSYLDVYMHHAVPKTLGLTYTSYAIRVNGVTASIYFSWGWWFGSTNYSTKVGYDTTSAEFGQSIVESTTSTKFAKIRLNMKQSTQRNGGGFSVGHYNRVAWDRSIRTFYYYNVTSTVDTVTSIEVCDMFGNDISAGTNIILIGIV